MLSFSMKSFNIIVNNMIVDNQVRVIIDSGGFFGGLGEVKSFGSGCGYGGEGGGIQGGLFYGFVFEL